MSKDVLQVCQSFMVVLKCRPGSADAQAAQPIFSQRSRALSVFVTFLLVRPSRLQRCAGAWPDGCDRQFQRILALTWLPRSWHYFRCASAHGPRPA
jgi:hypothetical protein